MHALRMVSAIVAIFFIAAGVVGCSDGDERTVDATISSSSQSTESSESVASISRSDLILKTVSEVEALLTPYAERIEFEVIRRFFDASLSQETEDQQKKWIITSVCFVQGSQNEIKMISASPAEITEEYREEILAGGTRDSFPLGECDTSRDSLQVG